MAHDEHKNRMLENTGTAIAVATALEVIQSSATRSESVWARIGGFALNVLVGLGTLTAFDAIVGQFTKKRAKKAAPDTQHAEHTGLPLHDHHTRTDWAQSLAEDKSCGCPYRH